jgi:putative heme-binding domain-containing protein
MEQELAGQRLSQVPDALAAIVSRLLSESTNDPIIVRWALRLGSSTAYRQALDWAADAKQPEDRRLPMISLLGQVGDSQALDVLLSVAHSKQSEGIRLAAITGLERFGGPRVTQAMVELVPSLSPALRQRSIDLLCSRAESSATLLAAVDSGAIDPQHISIDQLRRIVGHGDPSLTEAVEKRWGKIRPATAGEKQAMIVVLNRTLSEGAGNARRGKQVFTKHCANCHALFGEGAKIGPDLTSIDRRNRSLLLLNIVDPSSTIRPEFVSQTLVLEDGRVLTGLVTENSAHEITLVDAKAQKAVIPQADIEQIKPAELSLMPEKLLESLRADELRDLFSYLQATEPTPVTASN